MSLVVLLVCALRVDLRIAVFAIAIAIVIVIVIVVVTAKYGAWQSFRYFRDSICFAF